MTDTNNISSKKVQAAPGIEAEFRIYLAGDMKERALGFAAYLQENQLTPRQWFGPGYWRVPCGENYLCCIVVDQSRWRFWFLKGDYSGAFEEQFTKAVHDHVRPCISCTTDCQFVKDMTVFGRDFENTCFQFPVQFENPDDNTLESVKALIAYWKVVTPYSDSWHVRD